MNGAPSLHLESRGRSHLLRPQIPCSQRDRTSGTSSLCRSMEHGACRGATHPKTCGFRPRQVFLRHTCRVGRSP